MTPRTVSEGEWDRWREDDRLWKREAMDHLIDHTERLATLEGQRERVDIASASAEHSKRLSLLGSAVGVIVNALLVVFGHNK